MSSREKHKITVLMIQVSLVWYYHWWCCCWQWWWWYNSVLFTTCQGCGCCCILWCGVTLLLSLHSALHSSVPSWPSATLPAQAAQPRLPASPGRPAAGPAQRGQCQLCWASASAPLTSHCTESGPALFKYHSHILVILFIRSWLLSVLTNK